MQPLTPHRASVLNAVMYLALDCRRWSRVAWRAASLTALLAIYTLGCNERSDLVSPAAAATHAPVSLSSSAAPLRAAGELEQGALVPDLPFVLQDGFQLLLRGLKGKLIAVYFCPGVDDPECVRETEGLRDRWPELQEKQHVTIVGVSPQDAVLQRNFIAQHKLPFDLTADVDGHMATAFGVPTRGPYTPRVFLIGKDNRIRAVWRATNPEAHVEQILAAANE
ncbi:MAG TPA: redoxin domain-containing protein [Polyangiales bacterium]|nr:redoxin domain-containing protein [Polyangiales bacterium]